MNPQGVYEEAKYLDIGALLPEVHSEIQKFGNHDLSNDLCAIRANVANLNGVFENCCMKRNDTEAINVRVYK